jgi:hypothetical protein
MTRVWAIRLLADRLEALRSDFVALPPCGAADLILTFRHSQVVDGT